MKLLNKCPAYSWRGVNKDANSVTEQMVCGRYYGNSYPYALNMPTENKSKIGTLSATRARQLKSDPGEWDSENTYIPPPSISQILFEIFKPNPNPPKFIFYSSSNFPKF